MKRIITRTFSTFTEEENSLCETLFHNANGYIGVRGSVEEGVPAGWDTMRGSYINGFYDIIPMRQAESLCNLVEEKETMLNIADTITLEITVEGETFTLTEGTLKSYERILDMDHGLTVRKIDWVSPQGREVQIEITRMTSFELLPLFTMSVKITSVCFHGNVSVKSYHMPEVKNYCNPKDPRLAAESRQNLNLTLFELEDGCSAAVTETTKSGLSVCTLVEHQTGEGVQAVVSLDGNRAICEMQRDLSDGETLAFTKNTIYVDSRRYDNLKETALSLKDEIHAKGMDYYYEKQTEYLAQFWHSSRMVIEGEEALNNSVNFNMYQLLQSVGKDQYSNIAAKGMSGEGYEGHYFWDTEMFILPYFTLTNPQIAKMLLSYRHACLPKARENAALLGHRKGVLFPWRTITGVECSGYFPSGTAAYHINGDIAYALVQYYIVTEDAAFMKEKGIELLVETARLWMDVGNYAGDEFHINDVTGPDEYTCMVNNNYYTNCGAKYNLEWACRMYETYPEAEVFTCLGFTEREVEEMKQAAEKMFLPYEEKLGINPQDDSFLSKPVWDLASTPKEEFPLLLHYHPLHLYRYQVCKQADTVFAYFLYENEQTADVMKRSYEYYEKITTHDSSLSTCVFSIVASRLGMKEKGYGYFGDSLKLDLENTHHNTKDGIHTANMGGCYMAVVYGFAGLRMDEKNISFDPFVPEGWSGYEFVLRYHGRLIEVNVHEKEVKLTLLEGSELAVTVHGETKQVGTQKEIVYIMK